MFWRHLRVTLPSTRFCRPLPNFSAKAPFRLVYHGSAPTVAYFRVTRPRSAKKAMVNESDKIIPIASNITPNVCQSQPT